MIFFGGGWECEDFSNTQTGVPRFVQNMKEDLFLAKIQRKIICIQ